MLPVDDIRLNFNPASLVALNVVLGFLMFGIALDTRVADFRRVLRMPGAMAVGVAAQFIVLPAVTFVLTLLLKPGPSIALGMILVACCPPGNVSNILTHRAGGNVALSVSMTAISNALAIVLMPLNFAFWGGLHPRRRRCFAALRWTHWRWQGTSWSSSGYRSRWAFCAQRSCRASRSG